MSTATGVPETSSKGQVVSTPVEIPASYENTVPTPAPAPKPRQVFEEGPREDQVLEGLVGMPRAAGIGRFVGPVVAKFDKFLDKVLPFSGNLDHRGLAVRPAEQFLKEEVYS